VTALAILIRIELEAAPKVLIDAARERDHDRLLDWLEARPGVHGARQGGSPARGREAGRVTLHHDDELELRYLVGIAWGRRHEADALREGCEAIVDWFDRRQVRAYERRLRSRAAVLQVLRDTGRAA